MKKLLTTAVAGMIFVGTANAQGTWYTDYSTWLAQMTSIGGTAEYNSLAAGDTGSPSYTEAGVTLTNNTFNTSLWSIRPDSTTGWICSSDNTNKLTLSFAGNGFWTQFLATDPNDNPIDVPLTFRTSDNNLYNVPLTNGAAPFSFLGYISDQSSPISVDIDGSANFATIDSFTFGNGTNATNPGSAVPEPGEYVSMAILGVGLCGMIARSRRIKKS